MAGLKEFKEKLAQDAAFVEEARKCGDYDELVMFAEAKGFSFTEEEIEALTDLSEDELSRAAGGQRMIPDPTAQALVSGAIIGKPSN